MSEYTPTTDEIREAFQNTGDGLDFKRRYLERGEEFDRMIAEVERAAAEKARTELMNDLLPVLEDAVSNAYMCKNDRGIGDEWDDDIERASAALKRAEACRRNEGENDAAV